MREREREREREGCSQTLFVQGFPQSKCNADKILLKHSIDFFYVVYCKIAKKAKWQISQ